MSLPSRTSNRSNSTLREALQSFAPLNQLYPERLAELAGQAKVINLQAGCKLFSCIDTDKYLIYLLDGNVELRSASKTITIKSRTDDAVLPLNAHAPYRCTAINVTSATLIYIERNLLDILLGWDTATGYCVEEISESNTDNNDWMSLMLRSTLFHKIPPVNIQRMLTSLDAIYIRAGDILFRQGDTGGDFYFIQSGTVKVIRTAGGQKHRVVASLGPGDSFGEEALLSNQKRNATIFCVTDATLLRLSKTEFDELLKTPVVQEISFMHAQSLYQDGAIWLDVRQPEEQHEISIKNALSVPLGRLRSQISGLDRNKTYIIICSNGQRSACATYLLNAYGINAFVLKDGLKSLK